MIGGLRTGVTFGDVDRLTVLLLSGTTTIVVSLKSYTPPDGKSLLTTPYQYVY